MDAKDHSLVIFFPSGIAQTAKSHDSCVKQGKKDKDDQAISEAYQTLLAMVNVIGFVYEPRQLSDDELKLYQSWNDAKAKKDFQTADKIRDELIDKGII